MGADDTDRDRGANKKSEREFVGYESWIETLRSCGSWFDFQKLERQSFAGWCRPVSVGGFRGAELSHNAPLIRRIPRDIRADGADYFGISLQLSGSAEVTQNDQAMSVSPGDIIVSDWARPLDKHTPGQSRVITLRFPRADFVTHMGFEPWAMVRPSGASLAGRMLAQVFESVYLDEGNGEPDLDLIIYDVIRALFRPEESMRVSSHTEKLFERLQHIIERHFTNPAFGPAEVALEAGISSRYLQKLFASRGTTCNRYIESRRLQRAFKLLQRRIEQNGGPSIAEIAFASGYSNVSHFHSRFRRRFGRTPGAPRAGDNCIQTRDIDDPDTTA
jgi:AraC-like DNA-binding protein